MEKRKATKNSRGFSKYLVSILLFLLFEAVAVTLWLTKDNMFYLLNFSYIGCCLALGTALFTAGKQYARHFVQLAVGSYMLLYLGVISRENMQIEGFWYYLFLGVFEAATIHYAVAKLFGPLLFGRSALCDVYTVVGAGFQPVPDEGRESGADHVLDVLGRKRTLLHRGHRAGVCVQGQPRVLQVSLPHHGVSQAHELFFTSARALQRKRMRSLRQVPACLPYECGG